MIVFALDPGTRETGWVVYDSERVCILAHGFDDNETLLLAIRNGLLSKADEMVCEKLEGFGISVGEETMETIWWSGRFGEAWRKPPGVRVGRKTVKLHLCGTTSARDSHVDEALRCRFGVTKKHPGILKGLGKHERAALSVALTHADRSHKEGLDGV